MIEAMLLLIGGGYTTYVPPTRETPRIEAIIQRGILTELVIKCAAGTAIVSFSEGDGKYCVNPWDCSYDAKEIIVNACAETLK